MKRTPKSDPALWALTWGLLAFLTLWNIHLAVSTRLTVQRLYHMFWTENSAIDKAWYAVDMSTTSVISAIRFVAWVALLLCTFAALILFFAYGVSTTNTFPVS